MVLIIMLWFILDESAPSIFRQGHKSYAIIDVIKQTSLSEINEEEEVEEDD